MFDLSGTTQKTGREDLKDEPVVVTPATTLEFKTSPFQGSLDRDLLMKVRKNIADLNYVDSVMAFLTAEQLIELQIFLWREAIEFSENTLQRSLAREFITSRMEPTANYHRRQMCSEPLTACRANFCVHSNPECASRKLREQIRSMVKVFDRRTARTAEQDKALQSFLQNVIQKFGLFAAVVTTGDGLPIAAMSDLESAGNGDRSEFVGFFCKHLERYARNEAAKNSVYFDVPLQAVSNKVTIGEQTLIVTILSVKNRNLDVAMFQATIGLERIYQEKDSDPTLNTTDMPCELSA